VKIKPTDDFEISSVGFIYWNNYLVRATVHVEGF